MPKGSKKRKAAKKKKELGLQPTSPSHSSHSQEGNGGDDSMAIGANDNEIRDSEDRRDSSQSGIDDESIKGSEESERKTEREVSEEVTPSNLIAPDSESKDVHVVFVQSVKVSNGDLSGGSGSSCCSSGQESPVSIDNEPKRDLGRLVDGDSVASAAFHPNKKVISQVKESSPDADSPSGSDEKSWVAVDSQSVSSVAFNPIEPCISQSEELSPESNSWVAAGNQSEMELDELEDSDSVASLAFDPVKQVVPESEELAPVSKFCSGGESHVVVDNRPEVKLGKLEDSDSVSSPPFDSIKQVVSQSVELSPNTESCSSSQQEVQVTVDDSGSVNSPGFYPIKQVVSQSEESSSNAKSSPSKDPKVLDAVDFPSDNNKERIAPYQGTDTKDEGEFHKEQDNQGSSEHETTLVLPPVRPSSWRSCCGLFELLRGSNT